jgi:hypothetical protein
MRTFRFRRWRNVSILLGVCLLAAFAAALLTIALRPTGFYTGWVLFVCILALASYNLFKKLPFLNLGSAAAWLQFHVYVGWFSILLFVLHLGPRFPTKPLGLILAVLYVSVAGSGVVGLFLSRWIPPRLRARGEEVLYERIPAHRRELRQKAEQLAADSVKTTGNSSIADFYAARLKPFFAGPRHFWSHLLHANLTRRRALLDQAQDQQRYMNDQEREIMRNLTVLAQTKDDLDYQRALQGALKFWLFVHIPLTYSLLIFALFHVFVVYTFSGVIR